MTDPRRFTREDLTAAREASQYLRDFEAFILDRFAQITRQHTLHDVTGGPIPPIQGDPRHQNGGWSRWRVVPGWANAEALEADESYVTLFLDTSNDRGPSSTSHRTRLPLDLLFVSAEQAEDYAEYLRLRAIFDPAVARTDPAC